jgi:hypothetical protein
LQKNGWAASLHKIINMNKNFTNKIQMSEKKI